MTPIVLYHLSVLGSKLKGVFAVLVVCLPPSAFSPHPILRAGDGENRREPKIACLVGPSAIDLSSFMDCWTAKGSERLGARDKSS